MVPILKLLLNKPEIYVETHDRIYCHFCNILVNYSVSHKEEV